VTTNSSQDQNPDQARAQTPPQTPPQTPDQPPPRLVDPRLAVRSDRHFIRAHGRSERFLLVDVVAPTVAPDLSRRRPPVNLGFVLDRSGSMGGQNKIGLAKQAVLEATGRLDAPDRLAVITYDNEIEVVLGSIVASPEARKLAADRLRAVDARGSTDLHGGWLAGCEQVASGIRPEGVNRVLLLTDGLANIGVTDPEKLTSFAYDLRRRGVTTSTFGVGNDFDESLLQSMADAGGGHFYYIGDVAQMRDHITSEVGETLEIVAREVVLELTMPESTRVEALSPFRVEQRGGRVLVYLGDMVSGQVLSIVLRLTFDYGEVGREVGVLVRVADRDGAFDRARPAPETIAVAWAYADHAANDAQPRDRDVDRRAPQPRGPLRGCRQVARGRPQADRRLRGLGPGAARDRLRAARRGARLCGRHAGDGPQAALLRVEQPGPDANPGREVDPGRLTARGSATERMALVNTRGSRR
jgi:Ca-activated chloride channel homolog